MGAHVLGGSDDLLMTRGGRSQAVLGCGLAILMLVGCSDENEGGCAAASYRVARFTYPAPRAGHSFVIALSPSGATIRCDLAESGEADCAPNVGGYQLSFGAVGLRSITWASPPKGPLHVEVTIDGDLVTSQDFDYEPGGNGDACSGGGAPAPEFELE